MSDKYLREQLADGVTKEMLADVVQQYLIDLKKEQEDAKDAVAVNKEDFLSAGIVTAYQFANEMLTNRLSMLCK